MKSSRTCGADAANGAAVARIFAAKGRPQFNPLITHVLTIGQAEQIGKFSEPARRLAGYFWPGPLTLVVPRQPGCNVSDLVSAGLPTLALRVPNHAIAQALLSAAGRAIAAPSANRSGHVSATSAEHVAADLGSRVQIILDAGATMHGLESTIIDATSSALKLLRPGAIAQEDIEAVLGYELATATLASRPIAPGQLASHYAPAARLRLNACDLRSGEALLAFGSVPFEVAGAVINLSPGGDLIEAAARLFSALRELDCLGAKQVAVMPIPKMGLGLAINDRLERAAAPRN